MKGSAGIPALKLTVLNKLIEKFPKAPSMFFTNLFPAQQYESDNIKWDLEYGSAGMTPFVAPGAPSPAIGIDGVGEASAKAAYFKEKMYFDEEFLNNMKQPGTVATYATAERHLARGMQKLRQRCDRRREWMMSQMMVNGGFNYLTKGGTKLGVSYGVPETHLVTLDAARQWDDGADRNPVEDIFDAKSVLADDAGVIPSYAMLNSELLKLLILDTKLQALLSKSAFGNGDLFSNPGPVLANLLGVGELRVYDEMYEVQGWMLSSVVGASSTTVVVDDATDFEVGGKIRFVDMSEANVWEDRVITVVNVATSTITFDAVTVNSYVAGEDKVIMRKKFITDDDFLMFSTTSADGMGIAEFMESPYGLERRWGMDVDKKDEWDPDGVWIRVQDKGIPVMYHPDTTYRLTVR
jgi:hypothetical protein